MNNTPIFVVTERFRKFSDGEKAEDEQRGLEELAIDSGEGRRDGGTGENIRSRT